tara:strand:+ start:401 stop:592 length:192 start_codon:yes stop_codon:yes gene_type:complete
LFILPTFGVSLSSHYLFQLGEYMNLDMRSFIIGMIVMIVLLFLMGFSGGLGSSAYNPVYVKIV